MVQKQIKGLNLEELTHLCEKNNFPALPPPMLNLKYSDLNQSKFVGADLSGANLSGADLSNADLSSSILFNTDLSSTNLENIIIKNTNLSCINHEICD